MEDLLPCTHFPPSDFYVNKTGIMKHNFGRLVKGYHQVNPYSDINQASAVLAGSEYFAMSPPTKHIAEIIISLYGREVCKYFLKYGFSRPSSQIISETYIFRYLQKKKKPPPFPNSKAIYLIQCNWIDQSYEINSKCYVKWKFSKPKVTNK